MITPNRMNCILFLLALLGACSAPAPPPPSAATVATLRGVGSIGLPRLAFADDSPDSICFSDAGDLIRRHVRYELERRGYRVVTVAAPPRENVFRGDFLASYGGEQLTALAPEVDAVLLVRMDEYLGHDLCDLDGMASLDLQATGFLFRTGSATLIWEGNGKGSVLGGTGNDAIFSAGRELASDLFATLPARQ